MTTYTAVKSFDNELPAGMGMVAPVVIVATGSANYAAGDVITFPFVKPAGLKMKAAFASVNGSDPMVTGVGVRKVAIDNSTKLISVTIGTAIEATTGSISVLGFYGVDESDVKPTYP